MSKAKFDLSAYVRGQVGNVSDSDTMEVQKLSIDLLDANADNFYSVADVDDLMDSIAVSGVLQPIIVTPTEGGRYRIIAGHRRFQAVKNLDEEWTGEGKSPYRVIPAMVRPAAGTETDRLLERLALIQTNAAARKLSPAELDKQAAQMQEILMGLKKQGFAFPGRMRKLVADAVGVSETKLARLKAIRENLTPAWQKRWEAGQIPEYVAEALSHSPAEVQAALRDVKNLTPGIVGAAKELQLAAHAEKPCRVNPGEQCGHLSALYEEGMRRLGTGEISCTGCCRYCYKAEKCKSVCPTAVADRKKAEEARAAAYAEQAQARAAADKLEIAKADELWGRIAKQMELKGISAATLEDKIGARAGDISKHVFDRENLELPERKWLPVDEMDVEMLLAVAQFLGVPLEWLLDETLDTLPAEDTAQWRDALSVKPEDGQLVLILRFSVIIDWKHDPHTAIYRDGQFYHYESAAADVAWQDVRYWAAWPGGIA